MNSLYFSTATTETEGCGEKPAGLPDCLSDDFATGSLCLHLKHLFKLSGEGESAEDIFVLKQC
ncbi:hypothetical protein Pvag_pPag30068 (plasmid) [Pantoea vagans C9-1]|nr:hypothetical protein Pvag_pPag30068 [Pantoea vagans C9-1]